jgi:capsular polysaccharide transport system ATP-binding protein
MIQLNDIWKTYDARSGPVHVLKGVNLHVEKGDKVAIVGRNGAGKSTLIRLIGGIEQPTAGRIDRTMRVSWPLAFTGAFQGALTGLDNVRFICRVYGERYEEVIDSVEDFSQLGRFLKEPVRIYSSGMRARLAFALSLMIDFDCYLIDEVILVGDARFQDRCQEELFTRRADKALIIVSHDAHYLRDHCDRACVLTGGNLHHFDQVDQALEYHQKTMKAVA